MQPQLILLLTCLGMARGVYIVRLVVPEAVQAEVSPILLDCDYVLAEVTQNEERGDGATGSTAPLDWTKDGLVVKWYVDSNHLVYQWIPPRRPQALGVLAGRVDTSYRASPHPWAAHRALYIPRPHPALSGRYSCTVSTFEDEDTRSASLLVWSTARKVTLHYWRPAEDLVNITCTADGAAPRPTFALYLRHPNGTREDVTVLGGNGHRSESGRWLAGAWGLMEWASTPINSTLGCSVILKGVPATSLPQTEEVMYDNDLPIITTTTTTTTTAPPQLHHRGTNGSTSSSSSSPLNESFFANSARCQKSLALYCLGGIAVALLWSTLLAAAP